MSRFVLTSESQIKKDTLTRFLNNQNIISYTLQCIVTKKDTVEQPVSNIGTLICCKNRILEVIEKGNLENVDAIFSFENGIYESDGVAYDNVHVIIYDCKNSRFYYEYGGDVEFDHKYFELAKSKSHAISQLGWNYTAGEAMFDCDVTKNAKHWMLGKIFYFSELGQVTIKLFKLTFKLDIKGVDRHDQIASILEKCYKKYKDQTIEHNEMIVALGYDLHFKKGVIFKDIGPLMTDNELFNMLMDEIAETGIYERQIDYVLGIEARGFYLGPVLADRLSCAFIPVRKQGKLPMSVVTNEYTTEYSSDVMEVQPYLFTKPGNILIVDDLVATGGSFESAIKLIEKINLLPRFKDNKLKVVVCLAPLQVEGLVEKARKRLGHIPIITLI
ncbi:MAG: adenine phosphoribosyltransferase [Proteobacteria bacterium]|nr:adenine phosphoribosyltransferase [Pseudomonadota bacterium]